MQIHDKSHSKMLTESDGHYNRSLPLMKDLKAVIVSQIHDWWIKC